MTDGKKHSVLIVDDDEGIRSQLSWALKDLYEVYLAENATQARGFMSSMDIDVVALDIGLPDLADGQNGISLLEEFLRRDPTVKVIMITGQQDRELALKSVQIGAYDFYAKPFDLAEFRTILSRALYIRGLERENQELSRRIANGRPFEAMLGTCPQMMEVFEFVRKVSSTDATVLIYGESGTGKELVAKAIHFQSGRRSCPFVPINCGAIPENLLESEFFGHEKGAFTGAHTRKKGKFEIADQGSIFLDEIGELSPALQVKLLRFLQEREIERIGGHKPIPVDVRIIAATNRNLEKAIESGDFRKDLYYRLSVVTIQLPPLRERGEDIVLLANHFLQKYAAEYDKGTLSFSNASLDLIRHYPWPGNVRELENRIKRALIMARGSIIQPEDLDLPTGKVRRMPTLKCSIEEVERRMIIEALRHTHGNVSRAARELDVNRSTFYDLMRKHKIKKENESNSST